MANTLNILKPSGCFEIQKIIGISTIHGNCRTYLVQWASSWISGAHLVGCEDLIEQFEHEQKEEEHSIEEIDTNHSQNNCVLTDITSNDNVVMLHYDSAPDLKIKKEIQDNESKNTNLSPSPNHIYHQSNVGSKVSSLASIIQHMSGNDDKQYVDRNSVHPDFQRTQADVQNVNGVAVDSKGHLGSNSSEAMVIVREDTNCGETKDVQLQDVHYFSGGNRNVTLNNSLGKSVKKKCRKKKDVNIRINLLSNVGESSLSNAGESSRSCKSKQGKNSLERRNKIRKIFQCNICNKGFSNDVVLRNHSKLHKGIHRCATCFKTFAFKEHLQKHELIHITCTVCKEKFTDMDKLQAHMHTHKREKADPFECSYCEKRFSSKAHLEIHTRIHTGEHPFECKVCQRRFNVKHNLQRHFKTRHVKEGL